MMIMASLGRQLSVVLLLLGHWMALAVDAHGQLFLGVPFLIWLLLLLLLLLLALGLQVLQAGLFFVLGKEDGSSSFRGHFVCCGSGSGSGSGGCLLIVFSVQVCSVLFCQEVSEAGCCYRLRVSGK